MFSLLGPYMLWIKIGLVVLVVAGAFWFGVHTANNACEAGKTAAAVGGVMRRIADKVGAKPKEPEPKD